MIIGSHSLSHSLMSKLSFNKQKQEIEQSIEFLKNILDYDHKTYCHPYGGKISYNANTLNILNKKGIKYSLVENRDITKKDLYSNYQALPRYDCVEFTYGTAYI